MEEKNFVFTTDSFKESVIPLIDEGLTVPLKVSGSSMEPFLVDGRDTVFISKPKFPLKVGDIAFFERENGRIVMHRIKRIKKGDYYFIGDAEKVIEGPVSAEKIFGVVRSVNRKGKTADKKDLTFWFFRNVWIRIIPLRPFALKVYEGLFKKKT
ncbi:MAG: hypothetical protein E7660_02990 [Ruminococcaceae bacterium]|nr:hypothetical protein [Oscillospiraceae bacterium]